MRAGRRVLRRVLPWLAALAVAVAPLGAATGAIRVLLLSGANNHAWRETTPALRTILEADERCRIAVVDDVPGLAADAFAGCDVIVSNFNMFNPRGAAPAVWSPAVRAAFLAHVRRGAGFVVVHAGSSVFYDWPEFQRLAATTWTLGTTRHGRRHAARVDFGGTDHPIVRGLPPFWTFDEFWENLVVQPGATVLASVTPAPAHQGSGRPEPSLLVTEYGRGRSVCLLLGHDVAAMRNPGFRTLLVRATEWAARGTVTLPPPADWPDSEAAALAVVGPAAVAAAQPPAKARPSPKTAAPGRSR
jgi:type 1 glutamine amidotransferase